jgi:putative ABC transport system permease protein
LARKAGLGAGDTLLLSGPEGLVRFPIAGVTYDYSSEGGAALIHLSVMERAFGPGPVQNLDIYLVPGADPERVMDAMKAATAGAPLLIRSNQDIRDEVVKIFDQTFAITRILQGMALLIAVCGIALTLIILARERVAELALYRSLGAMRRQIFRIFLGEGMGLGALGLALGGAGGVALAAILIYVINRDYFGWTIQAAWPWADVARQMLIILLAAAAASLYPALRASRVPATELSHEDV